jgi:hypothetical protein
VGDVYRSGYTSGSETFYIVVPISSVTVIGSNPRQFPITTACGTSLPITAGAKKATLNVNAGGGDGTQTVALSGTGT